MGIRLGLSLGLTSGLVGLTPANATPPTPPTPTPFTVGQAYALEASGTGFGESMTVLDGWPTFAAAVRPLGAAGIFDIS